MALTFSKTLANLLLGYTGGDDLLTLMDDGWMHIYSGAKPASPEAVETGTLLAVITHNGAAYTTGPIANGLHFEAAASVSEGVLSKKSDDVWMEGSILATDTAGWFRLYGPGDAVGASTTTKRIDGTVGSVGTEDLVLATAALITGAPLTIDTFNIGIPVSG